MKKRLFALLAIMALTLAGCSQAEVSLGVIGGADGPTAIFVSAAPYWWAPFAMIAAVAIVIAVVRRKKRG